MGVVNPHGFADAEAVAGAVVMEIDIVDTLHDVGVGAQAERRGAVGGIEGAGAVCGTHGKDGTARGGLGTAFGSAFATSVATPAATVAGGERKCCATRSAKERAR